MMKLFLALLVFSSINTFSTEANERKLEEKVPAYDDIRCEKLSGMKLTEFKEKLVENCNLNKPFSTSMTRVINEDIYLYCCQTRK
jgi:hypothetical protein